MISRSVMTNGLFWPANKQCLVLPSGHIKKNSIFCPKSMNVKNSCILNNKKHHHCLLWHFGACLWRAVFDLNILSHLGQLYVKPSTWILSPCYSICCLAFLFKDLSVVLPQDVQVKTVPSWAIMDQRVDFKSSAVPPLKDTLVEG